MTVSEKRVAGSGTSLRAIITQREELGKHGGPVDSLEREYVDYFAACGVMVFPISSFTASVSAFAEILDWDLVLLTGGGIVPRPVYRYDVPGWHQTERDRMEKDLIDCALARGIPVVGICRGMHQLNGYFGGRVSPFGILPVPRTVRQPHLVCAGTGKTFPVNHFHRDGIFCTDLAPGLVPLAWDAENGLVEAFTHSFHPILGVQWHPERMERSTEANRWFLSRLRALTDRRQ